MLYMQTIRVYLAMLKEEMEKKKVSVGFLDIEAAVSSLTWNNSVPQHRGLLRYFFQLTQSYYLLL